MMFQSARNAGEFQGDGISNIGLEAGRSRATRKKPCPWRRTSVPHLLERAHAV